mmetsp:Transcript_13892/g.30092  ORF Transcript_13892/g.30092 Transcript_13892/m.30092 type:complete len:115 (-) Transcript_13892:211-555(-)
MKLVKQLNYNCCGCCCLPEMVMHDKDSDEVLGFIRLNCTLCPQISVSVFDRHDHKKFDIISDCCPLALVCRGPCCQEMNCDVVNNEGTKVGSVQKKKRGCLTSVLDQQADTFKC